MNKLVKQLLHAVIVVLLTVNDSTSQSIVRFIPNTQLCDTASWKLVWNDEFEGISLDKDKWYTFIDDDNWIDNKVADPPVGVAARATKKVIYKDNNINVGNGICTITMKYEPSEWMSVSRNFSSGMIMAKHPKNGTPLYFTQGRYEIRVRIPKSTGVWATFWLYGGGNNQQEGSEIDMFEYAPCKSNLNRMPYHFHGFHRGENFSEHHEKGDSYYLENLDDWHIYLTEWDRHFIRLYVDGNLKHTFSRYNSSCTPDTGVDYTEDIHEVFPKVKEGMKLLLTLDYTDNLYSNQIAGICLPIPRWLRTRSKFDMRRKEQKLEVDYIRVYQRNGSIQPEFK